MVVGNMVICVLFLLLISGFFSDKFDLANFKSKYIALYLKSISRILKGTDFGVYLVTLIYRLNWSYHSIPLHDNILLEQLNTTGVKGSYYNN